MFVKHVPYDNPAMSELYQADTGRFDYGVAVVHRTDPPIEELREITGWGSLSSTQVRIHPDANYIPEDGKATWVVRWVVQAHGAQGVLLITSGDLYILNDNGKTIDRVR